VPQGLRVRFPLPAQYDTMSKFTVCYTSVWIDRSRGVDQ
jgi:hypothetical protein